MNWLDAGNETILSGKPKVIDGDSLEIDGERLRLWGIDAPEFSQTCDRDGVTWNCGRQSRSALRELVESGPLSCITTGIDKYDRWLVECEAGNLQVNKTMVERGWALSYGAFIDEEDMARDRGAGIWSGSFERPGDWRRAQRGDADPLSATHLRTSWMRLKRLAKSALGL